jgi:D-alanyl-D-alanine carboxypeptidase
MKMMSFLSRGLWVVVGLQAISGIAAAAAPSAGIIVRQAQDALQKLVGGDGPGAVVLIAKGDDVVFRGARGLADVELGVPMTDAGVFRIASITKMFTAALILRLAEQHRLSLDDTLAAYIADLPGADVMTLRELLHHCAGVSDLVRDPQPGFSRRDVDTATVVAEIRKRPLDFAPGTHWSYSNAGYIVLGAVIEKITGERWYDVIDRELLKPAGLRSIRYGDTSALIRHRVAGYSGASDGALVNAAFISPSIPAAAGGLVADASDLLRWMCALSHGRVISAESFALMTDPEPRLPGMHDNHAYGFGVSLWRLRGRAMFGHTGQINGFASALVFLPADDVTVVVLANDDRFDANTAARRFAAIAVGEPYFDATLLPLSSQTQSGLAGTYGKGESAWTFSSAEERLYARRAGGRQIEVQADGQGQVHVVGGKLSYFAPIRDRSGRVIALDYFEDGDAPARRLARQPSPTPPG